MFLFGDKAYLPPPPPPVILKKKQQQTTKHFLTEKMNQYMYSATIMNYLVKREKLNNYPPVFQHF